MKKTRSRKNIPITAAKQIAKTSGYDEIVIFGYDPVSGQQHVTTYGRTLVQCKDAARAGNFLKKALGWAEAQCHAKPARDKTPVQKPLEDPSYRIRFSGVSLDPKLNKCHIKGCRNGACTSVWNYPGIPGRVQTNLCAVHVQELYERTSVISTQAFSIPSITPGVGPIPIEVRHHPPLDPETFFREGVDATTGELRDCVRGVRMIGRSVHVKDDLQKCRYEVMTGFDLPYEMLDAVFPGQTGPWTLERVQDLLVGDVERRIQLVKEERERTGCGMAEALQRVKEREGI